VFAAKMRPREPAMFAQEIAKMQARLDQRLYGPPVHSE
jgi:hypothetical protein